MEPSNGSLEGREQLGINIHFTPHKVVNKFDSYVVSLTIIIPFVDNKELFTLQNCLHYVYIFCQLQSILQLVIKLKSF